MATAQVGVQYELSLINVFRRWFFFRTAYAALEKTYLFTCTKMSVRCPPTIPQNEMLKFSSRGTTRAELHVAFKISFHLN